MPFPQDVFFSEPLTESVEKDDVGKADVEKANVKKALLADGLLNLGIGRNVNDFIGEDLFNPSNVKLELGKSEFETKVIQELELSLK